MPPAENHEGETPKYNLPPVAGEASADIDPALPAGQAAAPETAQVSKSPKSSSSKTQITDFQLQDFSAPQPTSAAISTTTNDNPTVADDNDLIEKEWVEKAKKIIEQNREDPRNQSKEMTLFRADYMKKRYNKAIKVDE